MPTGPLSPPVQYDAINSDISGEDASPDFWESAARITETGWTLEPVANQLFLKVSYAIQR